MSSPLVIFVQMNKLLQNLLAPTLNVQMNAPFLRSMIMCSNELFYIWGNSGIMCNVQMDKVKTHKSPASG